jgi:hypothetical protein
MSKLMFFYAGLYSSTSDAEADCSHREGSTTPAHLRDRAAQGRRHGRPRARLPRARLGEDQVDLLHIELS